MAVELGIEAQAELQRLRSNLGLCASGSLDLPSVGRYRLEEELGQGGMGVVYRAYDPELDRTIAIKLVRSRPLSGEHHKMSARLLREAKALAKLTHPNVVRVYDFGSHRGEVFLAMELVEGQPLRRWQTADHVGIEELLDTYILAAEGLAAAHLEGIVHRDFKPDNVFVANDGRTLVGDFGLAGALRGDEWPASPETSAPDDSSAPTLTRTGSVLGTLAYMAPEQLRGDETDPRSDQFAFCVSLWEAITGQRPFEGKDPESLLASLERGELLGAEKLPPWLSPCLRRGLCEESTERYASIHDLVDDMDRARPRPRQWSGLQVFGAASASAAAVALAVWSVMGGSAPSEASLCELEQRVVELREEDSWSALRQRLESASASDGLERLHAHTLHLQDTARLLCDQPHHVGIDVQRQQLQRWLDRLRDLLGHASTRPLSQTLDMIRRLDRDRFSAPPPRQIDDAVLDAIRESEALEREDRLPEALVATQRGVELANKRPLELAVALIGQGRILALQGKHKQATRAYERAMNEAEYDDYDEGRLQARLRSAKTALMRVENREQGERDLNKASTLFDVVKEPSLSPRRADYQELFANLSMLREDYETAKAHQRQALEIFRDLNYTYERGIAHINLGVIYERSGDEARARHEYEEALSLLGSPDASPASLQAAYNLGHWLVLYGGDQELHEAERLLLKVREASQDLKLAASYDLVLAAIEAEDVTQVRSRADALALELKNNGAASASEALDAWSALASAWAYLGQTVELEHAASQAYKFAGKIGEQGHSEDTVNERLVRVEMTHASALSESDPGRARALAVQARARLPDDSNSTLSNRIREFLDELP